MWLDILYKFYDKVNISLLRSASLLGFIIYKNFISSFLTIQQTLF
jgi:hypothetical protein